MRNDYIMVCSIIILLVITSNIGSSAQIEDWSTCAWTNAHGEIRLHALISNNNYSNYPQIYFSDPAKITQIGTFHWLYGYGTPSNGTVGLFRVVDGMPQEDNVLLPESDLFPKNRYGPWKTQRQNNINGVPYAWRWAFPNQIIVPGVYMIMCDKVSELTWAVTEESYPAGAAAVEYYYLKDMWTEKPALSEDSELRALTNISPDGELPGKWTWYTGATVIIYPNSSFETILNRFKLDSGTWNRSGNFYFLNWTTGGWIDNLTLSADGMKLTGHNQFNTRNHIEATRQSATLN